MYSVYWDLYTNDTWKKKLAELEAEQTRTHKLEAATVEFAQPGDPEKEEASTNRAKKQTSIARRAGQDGAGRNGSVTTWRSIRQGDGVGCALQLRRARTA
jgi:hypothetical protein